MNQLKEGDQEKQEEDAYDYMTQMMSPGPAPGPTTDENDDNFQRANNDMIQQSVMRSLTNLGDYEDLLKIHKLANQSFPQFVNQYNNQILVMPDQKVSINTVDKGLQQIDLKELAEDKEQLELSDFKTLETLAIDEGCYVSAIVDWGIMIVHLQHEDGKEFHWSLFSNDEYKQIHHGKWEIKKTIIKSILHDSCLYVLDLEGTVSYHIGNSGKHFTEIMHHCTDIFVNDSLYAKQSILSEQGQLVNQVVKKVQEEVEIQDGFQLDKTIVQARLTPCFFTQSISVGKLMLLVNGSTLFIRNEVK